MTMDTFIRDDLANYGKEPAADETPADETVTDEVAGEAAEVEEESVVEEAERTRAERAELDAKLREARGQPQHRAPAPAQEEPDDMPDLSDPDVNFDSDKLRTKTQRWIKSQVSKGVSQHVAEQRAAANSKKMADDLNGRIAKFNTANKVSEADWNKTVGKNPTLLANPLNPEAGLEVVNSPHAAEILWYFGQNTKEAVRISKLSAREQVKEIGKIEERVTAAKRAARSTSAPKALDRAQTMAEFARQERRAKLDKRLASRKARGLK